MMKKWSSAYKPLKRRWPFEYMVLKGGGTRGACEAAVCIELDRRGLFKSFTRFAGSSAGAITACLFAANFTPEQVGIMLMELPFPSFMDRSMSILATLKGFITEFGWFDGKVIENYVQAAVASACKVPVTTPVTFDMLYKQTQKTLVVTAFLPEVNGGETRYYSHLTTPHMSVALAVHASSAFPGVWKPVMIDGWRNADGGTLSNMPSWAFNGPRPCEENRLLPLNPKTLNIHLYDSDMARPGTATLFTYDKKASNIYEYYMIVLTALLNQLEKNSIVTNFWAQTIAVDCEGMSALNVTMKESDKIKLLENGRKAASDFLDKC